jgi:hypothetical protein
METYGSHRVSSIVSVQFKSLPSHTTEPVVPKVLPMSPTNRHKMQSKLSANSMVQTRRVMTTPSKYSNMTDSFRSTYPLDSYPHRSIRRPPKSIRFCPIFSLFGRPNYPRTWYPIPLLIPYPPFRCYWPSSKQCRSLRSRQRQSFPQPYATPKRG